MTFCDCGCCDSDDDYEGDNDNDDDYNEDGDYDEDCNESLNLDKQGYVNKNEDKPQKKVKKKKRLTTLFKSIKS